MQRPGYIVPTLLILLVTCLVLAVAGWYSCRRASDSRPLSPTVSVNERGVRDDRTLEAIHRWQSCQPQHWRACLLQN